MARQAGSQAMKDAKLDNLTSVVISLGAQAAASATLWWALGEFTSATGWGRAITAATPFLTFPIAFLVRALLAPAAMDHDLRTQHGTEVHNLTKENVSLSDAIEVLKNPGEPLGFDDHLFQYGKAVAMVHGSPQQVKDGICFPMLSDTEQLNVRQAFFYRGDLFVVSAISSSMGSYASSVIGPDGPKHVNLKAVLQSVVCYPLGTYETVKRPLT